MFTDMLWQKYVDIYYTELYFVHTFSMILIIHIWYLQALLAPHHIDAGNTDIYA